jgi:hypothetical protein
MRFCFKYTPVIRFSQHDWQFHLTPISIPPSGGFGVLHLAHNLNLWLSCVAPKSIDGIILLPVTKSVCKYKPYFCYFSDLHKTLPLGYLAFYSFGILNLFP